MFLAALLLTDLLLVAPQVYPDIDFFVLLLRQPNISTVDTLPDPLSLEKPLLLTPYLDDGNITEARKQSRVGPGIFPEYVVSYSGYLTVDQTFNSNLFFWYLPAQNNSEEAPLLIWLQGGPGASSMIGLLTEIGPYLLQPGKPNETLVINPYTWNKQYNLLFIDNPVGTGFSFCDQGGYTRNLSTVAIHLHKALLQFYLLFPELQPLPLYLTGESYAGKYVPALAYTIHIMNNSSGWKPINLRGIAVGNGFIDHQSMQGLGEYYYNLGLIDRRTRVYFTSLENEVEAHILQNDYVKAFNKVRKELGLLLYASNYTNLYNFIQPEKGSQLEDVSSFLSQPHIREALHVGHVIPAGINPVYRLMIPDFLHSSRTVLEEVINNYRVMFYSGQLDMAVPYPIAARIYSSMGFHGVTGYKKSKRRPWFVRKELAGYFKSGGNFTEVLVRNAGHMVPVDKPMWALDLINRFINNKL